MKFRHIKAVEVIRTAEVFREGDSDFRFTNAGRPNEKERAFRAIRMSQVQLSPLENRANARKNMILSFDIGFKVILQVTELSEKI